MANVLDPSIPLSIRPVNVLDSFTSGVQARQTLQANALDLDGADQKRKMQAAQMLAQGVLSSDDPASAYAEALTVARDRFGFDTSAFPGEWGPEAQMALRMVAAPDAERTEFERLVQGLDPAEAQRALRIKMGLEPSASGPDLRTVGDTLLQVGEGGVTPLYTAPDKPGDPPAGFRRTEDGGLEYIPGGPGDPETIRDQTEARQTDDFERVYGPNGEVVFERGSGDARPNPPLREFEAKAVQFSKRMDEALPRVEAAEERLMADNGGPSLLDSMADNLGPAGNFVMTDEFQTYANAAREWISGLLRLDSGAAVPEAEFQRYFQTYFVQPGQNDETIANKRAARAAAMDAVRMVVPEGRQTEPAAQQGTRVIGGKTYIRIGDDVFEVPQ